MLPSTHITKFGRAVVILYLLLWFVGIIAAWIYWNDLGIVGKTLVVIVEMLFIPDLKAMTDVFK